MRFQRLGLLAVVAAAVGCHKADPFVGTWKAGYSVNGMRMEETVTNSADGGFISHSRASKAGSSRGLLVDDKGTWKKVSETSYDVKLIDTNWTADGGSAELKAKVADRISKGKGQILANANKGSVKTIKWKGNDEFTETSGSESGIFQRVP